MESGRNERAIKLAYHEKTLKSLENIYEIINKIISAYGVTTEQQRKVYKSKYTNELIGAFEDKINDLKQIQKGISELSGARRDARAFSKGGVENLSYDSFLSTNKQILTYLLAIPPCVQAINAIRLKNSLLSFELSKKEQEEINFLQNNINLEIQKLSPLVDQEPKKTLRTDSKPYQEKINKQQGPFFVYEILIPTEEKNQFYVIKRELNKKSIKGGLTKTQTLTALAQLFLDAVVIVSDAATQSHGVPKDAAATLMTDLNYNIDPNADLKSIADITKHVIDRQVFYKPKRQWKPFKECYLDWPGLLREGPMNTIEITTAPPMSGISVSAPSADINTADAGWERMYVISNKPYKEAIKDPKAIKGFYCVTSHQAENIQTILNTQALNSDNSDIFVKNFTFHYEGAKTIDRNSPKEYMRDEENVLNLIYKITRELESDPNNEKFVKESLSILNQTAIKTLVINFSLPENAEYKNDIMVYCKKNKIKEAIVQIIDEKKQSTICYINQKDKIKRTISIKEDEDDEEDKAQIFIHYFNNIFITPNLNREKMIILKENTNYRHVDIKVEEKLSKIFLLIQKQTKTEEPALQLLQQWLILEKNNFINKSYHLFLSDVNKNLNTFLEILQRNNIKELQAFVGYIRDKYHDDQKIRKDKSSSLTNHTIFQQPQNYSPSRQNEPKKKI